VKSEPNSSPERAPAFLPVAITRPKPGTDSPLLIRVQVRKKRLLVTVEWPTAVSGSCAAWLRELLVDPDRGSLDGGAPLDMRAGTTPHWRV